MKTGVRNDPVYPIWIAMRHRCYNPSHPYYLDYGARGIKVCARWHAFENFLADMGRPQHGQSLDRINNNEDYCPENCRWATPLEQTRNRRNTKTLTFKGETLCFAEWALKVNLPYSTIEQRAKAGWTTERILTTPHLRPTRKNGDVLKAVRRHKAKQTLSA